MTYFSHSAALQDDDYTGDDAGEMVEEENLDEDADAMDGEDAEEDEDET
ncbi:MAG: hypothetical protein HYW91_03720 [Candidatus Sungbacteria bacterium]|nr:hypothetical protein [Candidatus Sungbacteria bacterium]